MESQVGSKLYRKLHKISLVLGAFTIVLPLAFWNRIPEQLPSHFNAAGEVDQWSDKASLILVCFVVALLMGIMSIALYFVKTNMESRYSKEAEKSEMRIVYPMLCVLNLVMQNMFAYIMLCVVTCRPLGKWFMPVFLVGIFAPIAFVRYKYGKGRTVAKNHKKLYSEAEQGMSGIVYRTAIDWWIGLLLGGCEVFILWLALEPIVKKSTVEWTTLLLSVGFSLLVLPMFGIKYVMYEEYLLVSAGIFGKTRIAYQDIVEAKKSCNPLSSPAMSTKRIQIDYLEDGVHRMVLISPVNRTEFLEELEVRRERSKS